MTKIDLQKKTEALPGKVETYWFENESAGLVRTLFHRITIPLKPFDSGLEYEDQPVETEIIFECYSLQLDNPEKLHGLNLSSENYSGSEASLYIGNAHNWCRVRVLSFQEVGENKYAVHGELLVEFELERVAENETFTFTTTVTYSPIPGRP